MNKTYSMSIRVSQEELERLKPEAKIEEYLFYKVNSKDLDKLEKNIREKLMK